MNTAAMITIGVVALGAVGLVVALGSRGSPSSGGVRPGYTILPGCGFAVTDEAAALAYARAEGASAPSLTWVQQVMLRVFGPVCAQLQPAAAVEVLAKQPAFIYRLVRAALLGGIEGGRLQKNQAQLVLDSIRAAAGQAGIDLALLVPTTVEG